MDDVSTIAAYTKDMKDFLNESELTERRAFIESFVKEIIVIPGDALIRYTVPMPDDSFLAGRATEKVPLDASVLSTVHFGPQRGTRTPSERQLNRQFPGSSTSQHNRSIELTLAEVIVQADSITTYSRVVTNLIPRETWAPLPSRQKARGHTHYSRIVSEVQT